MFPLKDDVPGGTTPFVTIGLIALNVLVYLYQLSLGIEGSRPGEAAQELILEFGLTPCRLTGYCVDPSAGLPSAWLTILTSMFLHGGLFHVGGNMLYLWIFGDNVEDTLGHGRFLLFYLLSGVAAALAQTAVVPGSEIPMVGASGAVSGVLGAYLLLFPHARVLTLLIFGFFFRMVHIPAIIVLGFWIVVQFVNGLLTVTASAVRGEAAGAGVAWFAHVGGFVAGMALLYVLRPRRAPREPY
jgi:membrane associated rhomboid family serine protease